HVQPAGGMTATAPDPDRVAYGFSDTSDAWDAGGGLFVGAVVPPGEIQVIEYERVDYANDRQVWFHQRYIDTDLPVALDESVPAVQRIDQPIRLPPPPHFIVDRWALFGKHGQCGRQFRQSGCNCAVSGHVRLGKRRLVLFFRHFKSRFIDGQYPLARRPGQIDDRSEEHTSE